MFNQFSIIFGQQWQNYTLALITGVTISLAWMLWRSPADERGRVFDVCLVALIGGVIVGRVLHVGLNWTFFADRLDLIWKIHQEGGLNWQGVVIGAMLAGYVMASVRAVDVSRLIGDAVLVLPLLAFAGWYACTVAACAYGLPVERMADYPGFMTWLADDIYRLTMPRFATQPIGMMSSAILLLLAIILCWRGWLIRVRFPLILILLVSVSFSIAFLRGDYVPEWYGLRAGQWLDIGMMVVALTGIVINFLKDRGQVADLPLQ